MTSNSYNIPMSFKIDQSLLIQLENFCNAEGHNFSSAVRTGLILLFAKRYRKRNTRNTSIYPSSD